MKQRLLTLVLLLGLVLPLWGESGVKTFTVTIADSAQTSDQAFLKRYTLTHLVMPASFEGTTVTFEVTVDDSTWVPLYDSAGTQVSVTVGSSRAIYLTPANFVGVLGVRLVAGTAQTGAAVVTLIARGF